MKRGIQEANGYRVAFHCLIYALEVALLHGQQLCKSSLALLNGIGANHLADSLDAVALKEHMLGAAETDALCTQFAGLLSIVRSIGVGAHAELAVLVRPAHDAAELAAYGSVNSGNNAVVYVAVGTVEAYPITLVIGLAGEGKALVCFVHGDGRAARYAALAHSAGYYRSVAGHAAAHGQYALCGLHAFYVLGAGLKAYQYNLLTLCGLSLCILGSEYDLAGSSAGRCAESLTYDFCLLGRCGVKLGMEQSIKGAGLYHGHSFLLAYHALVHQIAGDLQCGGSGTLAVAGLEHVELLVLYGELHILHVAVVLFKYIANIFKLCKCLGELLRHLADGHRSTDTGHNVLALSVGQELAKQLLFAGGGVAGECNACAAVITHVTECHHLYVYSGAPGVRYVVIPTVYVGTGIIPAAEYGLYGIEELILGIVGEILTYLLLVFALELMGKGLEVIGRELGVHGDSALCLELIYELLKVLFANLHNYVGIHLYEAAIAVPCPAGVVGLLCYHLYHLLIEAQIKYGIHHAGHGGPGAGTDGYQQGILTVAELLAGDLFQLSEVFEYLSYDIFVDPLSVLIVLSAGFGSHGKSRRNRQTQAGHLGQVCALAAQQLTHLGVAFAKKVYVLLLTHLFPPY